MYIKHSKLYKTSSCIYDNRSKSYDSSLEKFVKNKHLYEYNHFTICINS